MKQLDNRKKLLLYIFLTTLIAILAFVIGYVSKKTPSKCEQGMATADKQTDSEREKVYQELMNSMKTENLRENLRFFSKRPHVASTERTFEISEEIYKRFKSYGFEAKFHQYETLLSFPPKNESNVVYILDQNGNISFTSQSFEKLYEENEKDATSLPPYLAYAPNGTVKGDLYYVNYGRIEDFELAVKTYNINFEQAIVLVKYGKIPRGKKVSNAARYGAIGVLIYGDPKDYAPVVTDKFPNGRWLSDDGVQRGSILTGDVTEGDPLTSGYPAKDGFYKEEISKVKGLPSIPAQPIAASDAETLLRAMSGKEVPDDWKGLFNMTYKMGPFSNSSSKVKLVVKNQLQIKKIRNVCGTILGRDEPDRYVILGNHIDSWVFGAVDASSGTTVMMEMARVLGEKLKTGWRPRRTIKLCGWDGEEFNLIGSSEYVEEFYHELRDRAVAYINIDSAVAGNYSILANASPLLHELLFQVHKQVSDPYIENMSVFQKCQKAYEDKENPDVYRVSGLADGGSDYFGFYQFVGISSIDLGYRQQDTYKKYNVTYYPQYHTLHDTVYWMENFVDKEYKIHLTVAKVAMGYLLQLSDSPVLPFDGARYVKGMKKGFEALMKAIKEKHGDLSYLRTDLLESAALNLSRTLGAITNETKNADRRNALKLRILNDKLMQFEKSLTYPTGLKGRPQLKNYIMAPSDRSVDSNFPFSAIADNLPNSNQVQAWDEMKKQISITAYLMQSVAQSLCTS